MPLSGHPQTFHDGFVGTCGAIVVWFGFYLCCCDGGWDGICGLACIPYRECYYCWVCPGVKVGWLSRGQCESCHSVSSASGTLSDCPDARSDDGVESVVEEGSYELRLSVLAASRGRRIVFRSLQRRTLSSLSEPRSDNSVIVRLVLGIW